MREEANLKKESIIKKANKKFKPVEIYINKNLYMVSIILLVVLLAIFILNITSTSTVSSLLKEKIESNKPSKIQLFIINCNGCSDVLSNVEAIKKQNVDVTNEEELSINDKRAKELIDKYDILNLPSVLIFGEIDNDKVSFNDFDKIDDAMILNKIAPPYLNVAKNELMGMVSLIELVDSSCEECADLSFMLEGLEQAGIMFGDWEKVEYNSLEGKDLIKEYDIKHSPAILLSEEIEEYEDMKEVLAQLDSMNKKGFYTIHSTLPPYRNLTTGKIEGIVDLIMLTDDTCSDCYDVNTNKQILKQFGIVLDNENTYDVSSTKGKQLILKYSIEKVPLIIVSPEANVYISFINAWPSIGSVEDDGWFVMRKPEIIGEITSLNSLEED